MLTVALWRRPATATLAADVPDNSGQYCRRHRRALIGGTLEMIALGWMNIGAAVAPDAALASIISTILVIAGHQSIGAGIALAIPLAAAGQVLTIIVRTITVAFQHAADKAAA